MENFANSLDQFDPIDGKPSNTDLRLIREVVAPIVLQIPYNKTGAVHNLIGLIHTEVAYTMHYGTVFLKRTRMVGYDATIDDNATAIVCERTEAVHKAKRVDWATYKTARQQTAQFILTVVEDTWVR